MTVAYFPLPAGAEEDPYPHYRRLREEDPVHWSAPLEAWVLTRYDHVAAALRDHTFSAATLQRSFERLPLHFRNEMRSVVQLVAASVHYSDGAGHSLLRRRARAALAPDALNETVTRVAATIDRLMDRLAGAMESEVEVDFIESFAVPLSRSLCAEMLTIPSDDLPQLERWADDLRAGVGHEMVYSASRRAADRAVRCLRTYFAEAASRSAQRRAGWTGALTAEHAELESAELAAVDLRIQLFLGTYETIGGFVGNGLLALLRHPDQMARLREMPALAATAVEELLRYAGPSLAQMRVTLGEVELSGRTLPSGARVLLVLAAANRDPARFEQPDRLDLARNSQHHLALGAGAHHCLGAGLARAVGTKVFISLATRLPQLRLGADLPRWKSTLATRSVVSLPVVHLRTTTA